MCDADTIKEHVELLHDMDKRIDKILTMQEITTTNVNKLTNDIARTMCNKNTCDVMSVRMIALEDKMKEMWFWLFASRHPKMVALMVLGGFVVLFSKEIKTLLGL